MIAREERAGGKGVDFKPVRADIYVETQEIIKSLTRPVATLSHPMGEGQSSVQERHHLQYMPPLTGLGLVSVWFYKDVAPTALGRTPRAKNTKAA
jgi:hypothetical protein